MQWESAEGRLISNGRTVASSDQIVLRRSGRVRGGNCLAYLPHGGRMGLPNRNSRALLRLDDGRCGWFVVTARHGGLLHLRSEGLFP